MAEKKVKKTVKAKAKVKKISLREKLIRWLGGVPAPQPRKGNVAVKPYNRKKPAAKPVESPATTTAGSSITPPHDTI